MSDARNEPSLTLQSVGLTIIGVCVSIGVTVGLGLTLPWRRTRLLARLADWITSA